MKKDNKEAERLAEATKLAVGARAAKMASLISFGRLMSLIISGIAFVIIARVLGPSIYGIYVLAISYAALFNAIADFGISTTISKFVAQCLAKGDKNELCKVLSNGYTSVIISGLIFTTIALLVSNIIAVNIYIGNTNQLQIIQVVSFVIFFTVLASFSYQLLVGLGDGKYLTLIILLQSILQSIISVMLAVLGFGAISPIIGLIAGYAISITTVFILLKTRFKIKFKKPSYSEIKKLITFSYPISAYNGLRAFISNLAPILLALVATTVIVGNFGVATKTAGIIGNIIDAMTVTILPMFAYTLSTKSIGKQLNKFYNQAIYLSFLLITPILMYLAMLSKEFSYTFFSAKYLLAPYYLSIICIGFLLWVVANYTTMLLISTNKVKEILKFSLIITGIELVLLSILIPLFGGLGISVLLYIISPILVILFLGRVAKKIINIHLDIMRPLRVVFAGLISVLLILPLIYILHDNYILILIIAAIEQIILYPITLALTKAIGKKEIKLLKDITAEIPILGIIIGILTNYSLFFMGVYN